MLVYRCFYHGPVCTSQPEQRLRTAPASHRDWDSAEDNWRSGSSCWLRRLALASSMMMTMMMMMMMMRFVVTASRSVRCQRRSTVDRGAITTQLAIDVQQRKKSDIAYSPSHNWPWTLTTGLYIYILFWLWGVKFLRCQCAKDAVIVKPGTWTLGVYHCHLEGDLPSIGNGGKSKSLLETCNLPAIFVFLCLFLNQ